MQNSYSDDHVHLAARLYYVDGLGQNDVAKFVKVSQAKVSRLLALARERGIVRITVADYEARQRTLEDKIKDQFGLAEVVVVKAIDGLENSELRRAVGYFGSKALDSLIQPKDVVAIAGGRTIYELVNNLPSPKNKALTVVQAMGSVDSSVSAFDAQEVGRVVAQKLGGSFLALNTPAFMPDKRTRDTLLKLDQVSSVFRQLGQADMALVGLGTLANSVFIERKVIEGDEKKALETAGAVGEVCGRFFDAKGNECDTPWRDRVMSADLDQLRRIPRVVGVVSGDDRSAAILAAIRGKLIKGLIIDESGASALLAMHAVAPQTEPKVKKGKK